MKVANLFVLLIICLISFTFAIQRRCELPTIQSGVVSMDQKHGWQANGQHGVMANGNGGRSVKSYVRFPKAFPYVPSVHIAITWFDGSGSSVRVNIVAEDITKEGFNAKFTTWADTHLWGVGASWIAH
jgi:hypothetical protein